MAIDKAVDSTVLDGYFYAISDAINTKRGDGMYISMTPEDMPYEIENLPSGGGLDPDLEALMVGNASGDINISLPTNCNALGICFSNSTSVGNGSVYTLALKDVQYLGSSHNSYSGLLLDSGVSLEEIHMPDMIELNMKKLSVYVGSLINLIEFDAPNLQSIVETAAVFRGSALKEFRCPKLRSRLASYVFNSSTALELVDITGEDIYGSGVFTSCSSLVAVVLRKSSSIVSLNSTGSFNSTPIAAGTGYIYVPDALKSTYQVETNWSTYSAQFRSIEDYTDDGTLTGEFIMPEN